MKTKILIWGLTYLLLPVFLVAQTEKKVPSEYPTIQEAINSAVDGDVISVAPGTYAEGINFFGKDIVVRSEDGPLVTFLTPASWGGSIAWFHNGEPPSAKLIGFTLKGSACCIAGPVLNFGYNSHPIIENCIITDNPGGIYYYYSGAVLKNCLIVGNPTNLLFKFDANSYHPEVINSTIADNGAFSSLPHPDHPAPKFKNCIIYGNEIDGVSGNLDISYSLVEGGFAGEGNIDADPLFVAAWNGDYHLQANSPAIDAGIAFGVPYSDIEGMPRPKGAGHDMGAYEAYLPVTLIPYTPDPTEDSTPILDWWDVYEANTYTLQYSDRSDFDGCTEVIGIVESEYEVTNALSDGVWYWRVRALDSEGVAGWWTALDYFVVETPITYTLTISADIGGTTDPLPGAYIYDEGTEVVVIATPESGYRFSGWTGDVPEGRENDNPLNVMMDSNKNLTANFTLNTHTLTTQAEPSGGGTVIRNPDKEEYNHGESVELTANANDGYNFSEWSGDASGTENPITIAMDSDKSVTANFSVILPEEPDEPKKKEGCFIATAIYGSASHPHVSVLREFRDKYLMPNKFGRSLVDLYYKHSPFVANLITKHKALKVAIRISLLPTITFSYLMVHFDPIIIAIVLVFVSVFPIFLISFFQRRLRRQVVKDAKRI